MVLPPPNGLWRCAIIPARYLDEGDPQELRLRHRLMPVRHRIDLPPLGATRLATVSRRFELVTQNEKTMVEG
jgi:hypothetical protein